MANNNSFNINIGETILSSIANISELRRVPTNKTKNGANVLLDSDVTIGDNGGGVYVWSSTSADAEQIPNIIKPNDRGPTEPGRWVKNGLTGLAKVNNNFTALADFTAAPTTLGTVTFNNNLYRWTLGDFSSKQLGGHYIKANSTPINQGAWVREEASDLIVDTYGFDNGNNVGYRLSQTINIRDFGPFADGFPYSVRTASQFSGWWAGSDAATLPIAKKRFGDHVDSMDRNVDWAAIQGAINKAVDVPNGYKQVVIFPAGRYNIGADTLMIPNEITLMGEGKAQISGSGTILKNSATAGAYNITIRDLVILGGTTGLRLDAGEIAYLNVQNCTFAGQSQYCMYFDRLLQCSNFDHVIYQNAPYGVYCPAFTTNMNNWHKCDFRNMSDSSIFFRISEANSFIGCRIESGGVAGKTAIDVTESRDLLFQGCYFESTHEYLFKETGSNSGVTFQSCHYTGGPGLAEGLKFQSDGVVRFYGGSAFRTITVTPDKMLVNGNFGFMNTDRSLVFNNYTDNSANFYGPNIATPTTLQKDLIQITRAGADGRLENYQTLKGRFRIVWFHADASGFFRNYHQDYDILVIASGGNTMSATVSPVGTTSSAGGATLAVRAKAGASNTNLIIEAVFGGVNPTNPLASSFRFSGEYNTTSTNLNTADNMFVNVLR